MNKEFIETAKQAMKDLSATNMLEHEQSAYNCLRLFIKKVENENIEFAEQQLRGFAHAKAGYSLKSLCESMGLLKDEWGKLKPTAVAYLSESMINEIENYFNNE